MSYQKKQNKEEVQAATSSNPFDVTRIRLPQDFGASAGVKKLITTVPIRKPNKHAFVRVKPGDDNRIQVAILEIKEGSTQGIYLIDPTLREELGNEIQPVVLVTAIDRQNNLFLWPIKLPKNDGKANTWNQSALTAAAEAEKYWVRIVANMNQGAYDILVATKEHPHPVWPDLSFQELINKAVKDNYIASQDHPVLKKLRGEE